MPRGRFRFGLFELDAETFELRREGVRVHLQAQPRQLLAFLVSNADRVVSREELRKTLWGDRTFVDFERGLNFCVSQMRSALGDDAASPTYIRTVAKQGYQFIAPTQWIAATDAPIVPANAARALRSNVLLWSLAAFLVATISLSATYVIRLRHVQKDVPIVAVVRFDNETGDAGRSRFTEDLTDNFVERLASLSKGQYGVIGNAQILRVPRDGRDLNAIAAKLRAQFIVLGQIQSYQDQTRILVHLIHMPEQTHVSVARMDRQLTNPLEFEAEAAQAIAFKFSQRIAAISSNASPIAVSH